MKTPWTPEEDQIIEQSRLSLLHILTTEGEMTHDALLAKLCENDAWNAAMLVHPESGEVSFIGGMAIYYTILAKQIRLKPRLFKDPVYVIVHHKPQLQSGDVNVPDHVSDEWPEEQNGDDYE